MRSGGGVVLKSGLVLLVVFLLSLAGWLESRAYIDQRYNPEAEASLNLRLGCPDGRNLTEWGPCWDDAAVNAAEQWNAAGSNFKFHIQAPPNQRAPVACTDTSLDNLTTVVWGDNLCGIALGSYILAATYTWRKWDVSYSIRYFLISDSDVMFNPNFSWDTYSGPLQSGTVDFHRVAVHEFGHVLGLLHPNEFWQTVDAIMHSSITDIDRLQADDIAGIRAIYTPRVALSVSPNPVEEGARATITATITGKTSVPTTVTVSAVAGSGTEASDFSLSSTTLSIPAGTKRRSGSVTLTAKQDSDTDDETVVVSATVTNTTDNVTAPENVSLTIRDDDRPQVRLSVSPNPVNEGSAATVTASIVGTTTAATTVTVAATQNTAETGDFSLSGTTLTIPAGTGQLSTGSVTLTAHQNADLSADTVVVSATVTNTTDAPRAPPDVTLRISDTTDRRTVRLRVSPDQLNEGSTAAVTADIPGTTTAATTVTVAATRGTAETGDFSLSGTTLTIPAGTGQRSTGLVILTARQDADLADETVVVSGTVANGTDPIGAPESRTVRIRDDDRPVVRLQSSRVTEGASGSLTAVLTGPTTAATTVTVQVAPGSAEAGDFSLSANRTLSFPAGTGRRSSTGTVTLTATQDSDTMDEALVLSGRVTNVTDSVTGPGEVLLHISDDDTLAGTVKLRLSRNRTLEGSSSPVRVSATIAGTTTVPTTVTVSAARGTAEAGDFSLSTNTTLSIPAGTNKSSTGSVTLTANADADTANETVRVSGSVTNATDIVGPPADVTLTIVDDDNTSVPADRVTLSVSPNPVGEGSSATVTATVTGTTTAPTRVAVRATPGTAEAGDFTLTTTTVLSIPAGTNQSSTGTVTLTANRDTDTDDETVTLSAAVSNTRDNPAVSADVTLTLIDDIRPPSAPTGLSATPGNGQVTLSWTAPTGGGRVSSYQYCQKTDATACTAPDWTDMVGSGPTTTRHVVTGLSNDTAYTFRLRATNALGSTGTASPAITTETPPTLTFTPAHGGSLIASDDITITASGDLYKTAAGTPFTDSTIDSLITLKEDNKDGDDIDADVRISGRVITIDPTGDLAEGQVYVAISNAWYSGSSPRTQGYAATATFTVVDSAAPTVSWVFHNNYTGGVLYVVLSEPVYSENTPAPGDFTLGGASGITVSTVWGLPTTAGRAARTFTLTLSAALSGSATLSYTPNSNTTKQVRDRAGNTLAAVTAIAVEVNPTGTFLPANGSYTNSVSSTLTVTVPGDIYAGATGAALTDDTIGHVTLLSKVNNDGTTTVLGKGVTMTKDTSATPPTTTLTITPDSALVNGFRYRFGLAPSWIWGVPSTSIRILQNTYVSAYFTVDTTAPSVASIVASGTTLTVILSEPVYSQNTPAPSDFTVTGHSVTAVTIPTTAGNAASTFTLTLSGPLSGSPTLNYTPNTADTKKIRDRAGNPLAAVTNRAITVDTIAPTISSVVAIGRTLTVTLSEPVYSASGSGASDFRSAQDALTATGIPTDAPTAASSFTLTAASALPRGRTLAYTQPSTAANQIRDLAGNALASFTGQAILFPPLAPTGLTAAGGNTRVDLAWKDPTDSSVSRYEYCQKTGSATCSATTAEDWTPIPDSDASTTSYRVPSLSNGTRYTFKLRAVNAAGTGALSASASATPTAPPPPPDPPSDPPPPPGNDGGGGNPGSGGGGGGGGAISPPDAPSSVVASLTTQGGTVTLTWTAEADEFITGWQYSPDNGATWTTVPGSTASTRTYTVRGLTPGREYTFRVRALNRAGIGARSDAVRATPASGASRLENPTPTGVQSGIGLLSGWVCAAGSVTFHVTAANGTTHEVDAAYGTSRTDTQDACTDSDNGFGLLFNWNLLGPGSHTVRLLVDGQEMATQQVTVVTLGTEFLHGASGRYTIEDFPRPGESVTLQWDEASQNFRLAPAGEVPPGPVVSGLPGSALENPAPNSVQSGIGLLSGWVCEAETVAVRITTAGGAVHELPVAYGTARADTTEGCGDSDNGFGLLFNWNLLGAGTHTVALIVDGVEEASQRVTVTTLGGEYVRGLRGQADLADFPASGRTVTVVWQEAQQNFVITAVE